MLYNCLWIIINKNTKEEFIQKIVLNDGIIFINATIHGLDIYLRDDVISEIKNNDKIKLYTDINAYDINFVNSHISDKSFDVILDDVQDWS